MAIWRRRCGSIAPRANASPTGRRSGWGSGSWPRAGCKIEIYLLTVVVDVAKDESEHPVGVRPGQLVPAVQHPPGRDLAVVAVREACLRELQNLARDRQLDACEDKIARAEEGFAAVRARLELELKGD